MTGGAVSGEMNTESSPNHTPSLITYPELTLPGKNECKKKEKDAGIHIQLRTRHDDRTTSCPLV